MTKHGATKEIDALIGYRAGSFGSEMRVISICASLSLSLETLQYQFLWRENRLAAEEKEKVDEHLFSDRSHEKSASRRKEEKEISV